MERERDIEAHKKYQLLLHDMQLDFCIRDIENNNYSAIPFDVRMCAEKGLKFDDAHVNYHMPPQKRVDNLFKSGKLFGFLEDFEHTRECALRIDSIVSKLPAPARQQLPDTFSSFDKLVEIFDTFGQPTPISERQEAVAGKLKTFFSRHRK